MENSSNTTQIIINTINTIFNSLFTSIDTKLYEVLDKLTFINSDIIQERIFEKIFGTSASNGLLLIANALLIGFLIYFAVKYMSSNITFSKIENPIQFILKLVIYGIAMNSSYFIIKQILDINSIISSSIMSIGEDLFGKEISFSNLITSINSNLDMGQNNLNIFTVEGIIKGTATISLINLVTTYGVRYFTIKLFVLLSPFAILSLSLENTSWIFKLWIRNLISMLLLQEIVALILLILFSINYESSNLTNKIVYLGGIYALAKANSFIKEFMSGTGISAEVQNNIGLLKGR